MKKWKYGTPINDGWYLTAFGRGKNKKVRTSYASRGTWWTYQEGVGREKYQRKTVIAWMFLPDYPDQILDKPASGHALQNNMKFQEETKTWTKDQKI